MRSNRQFLLHRFWMAGALLGLSITFSLEKCRGSEETGKKSLSARLIVDKTKAKIGESIIVTVLIKNETDKPVVLYWPKVGNYLETVGCRLQANGASTVRFSELWRVSNLDQTPRRPPSLDEILADLIEISPGDEKEMWRWDVSELVVPSVTSRNQRGILVDNIDGRSIYSDYSIFCRPGEYTLTFSFSSGYGHKVHAFAYHLKEEEKKTLQTRMGELPEFWLTTPPQKIVLKEGERTEIVRKREAAAYAWSVFAAWREREMHVSDYLFPKIDPAVVSGLILLAQDQSSKEALRKIILFALAYLGSTAKEAIDPIVQIAREDADIAIREDAILVLAAIEAGSRDVYSTETRIESLPAEKAKIIHNLLNVAVVDKDPRIRSAALAALYDLPRNSIIDESIFRALEDAIPQVRLNAVRLYLVKKGLDRKAARVLVDLLSNESIPVRCTSMDVLYEYICPPQHDYEKVKKTFSSEEKAALEHLMPKISALVVELPNATSDKSLFPKLEWSFYDRPPHSPTVAWLVFNIFSEIKAAVPDAVTQAAAEIIQSSKDKDQRIQTIQFLASSCGNPVTILPILRNVLRDKDIALRMQAAYALSVVDPQVSEVKPILLEFIKTKEGEKSMEAIRALARLRVEGDEVIGIIRNLLQSDNEHDHMGALEAAVLLGEGGKSLAPDIYRIWEAARDPKSPDNRSFYRNYLVQAIVNVAPESDEALAMWRQSMDDRYIYQQGPLLQAIVKARGIAFVPDLKQELRRRNKDSDEPSQQLALTERRRTALSGLGSMPESAATAAAEVLIGHGKWLLAEKDRGTDRYGEMSSLGEAMRSIEPKARTYVLNVAKGSDIQATRVIIECCLNQDNFLAFKRAIESKVPTTDPELKRSDELIRKAIHEFELRNANH
jgi:hypothetical protein